MAGAARTAKAPRTGRVSSPRPVPAVELVVLQLHRDRLDTPEFKFFAISLSVQKETGRNLAETLGNLSDILRRRKQMKLKIKAMSSEARASAYILGSLPFLMFGILFFVNQDYVMTLAIDPRGQMVAIVGMVMMTLGLAVMAKMVRFEI